jgi:hypothetical protein
MNLQVVHFLLKLSQPAVNDRDLITPPRSHQTYEKGLARKTLMLENSQASSLGWIELILNNWCSLARKP